MTRRTTAARTTTMNAHVLALEASFTAINSTIADAVNSFVQTAVSDVLKSKLIVHLDNHLPMYFEQFRRELLFRQKGESSSAPILPDPLPPCKLDPIQLPRNPNWIGGGQTLRLSWSLRVDFPQFVDGDDLLAWIYKAGQFFQFYNTPETQRVLITSFYLDSEALHWFK